jgi:adenylyltransferase/sulfurtransferase
MRRDPAEQLEKIRQFADSDVKNSNASNVIVVCRRGNDSQTAVELLQALDNSLSVKDIRGGLHAWAKDIDHDFPVY